VTPTFNWKIKRKNRFFLYHFETIKQILNKCEIQNQHGETGQRYDIILREFQAVYSEEWDWMNIIWFRDQEKIKPLIELAEKSGLYIY
jgi:ABC-type oligopeptide transport system substrate-binding subunit